MHDYIIQTKSNLSTLEILPALEIQFLFLFIQFSLDWYISTKC